MPAISEIKATANHPLVFWFTMVILITAGQRLFGAAGKKLGWNGIATFFK